MLVMIIRRCRNFLSGIITFTLTLKFFWGVVCKTCINVSAVLFPQFEDKPLCKIKD